MDLGLQLHYAKTLMCLNLVQLSKSLCQTSSSRLPPVKHSSGGVVLGILLPTEEERLTPVRQLQPAAQGAASWCLSLPKKEVTRVASSSLPGTGPGLGAAGRRTLEPQEMRLVREKSKSPEAIL